jgi:hypothetical protein
MLDYYSYYPPPSRDDAIKEVIAHFKEVDVREIATEVINEMPSLGSYTGWYMGFKKDAIQMVTERLENEILKNEILVKERLENEILQKEQNEK